MVFETAVAPALSYVFSLSFSLIHTHTLTKRTGIIYNGVFGRGSLQSRMRNNGSTFPSLLPMEWKWAGGGVRPPRRRFGSL